MKDLEKNITQLTNIELLAILQKYSIEKVACHSSEVSHKYAFVAIKGAISDGNTFIQNVLKQGVGLIFTESHQIYNQYKDIIPIYVVDNSRKILAEISTILSPHAPLNLIAVTGTSGKSSTVHYIAQLLSSFGTKAATIGTLGVKIYHSPNKTNALDSTGLTSPDIISFNKTLAELKEQFVEYCAIEASSIGIDQYRMFGRKFKVAAFTSFSQDHLDYHQTMENYLDAKLKLFDDYMEVDSVVIINSDMAEYQVISNYVKRAGRKQISVGKNGDCKIKIIKTSLEGQYFELNYNNHIYKLYTKILGAFQIKNISISLLVLDHLYDNMQKILDFIPLLVAPSGRLERISNTGKGSQIFIDYSHKPEALENVLKDLRIVAEGNSAKIIVIFGCGGDRDKTKRPIMGAIACNYANLVIVTDDNPRHEDPGQIRQEILAQAPCAIEIADRREAIKYGIEKLKEGDILLIAGKGDETYQIIGNKTIPFSDKEVASSLIARKYDTNYR